MECGQKLEVISIPLEVCIHLQLPTHLGKGSEVIKDINHLHPFTTDLSLLRGREHFICFRPLKAVHIYLKYFISQDDFKSTRLVRYFKAPKYRPITKILAEINGSL